MRGVNLHGLVRGIITAIHPDEQVILYQSVGQTNVAGKVIPIYAAPQQVAAQVQSVGDAALAHADRVGQNDVTRHLYLFASPGLPPAGVVRPLARGGDMIQRAAEHGGTWWLVVAVPEDFSAQSGWVLVRASLQVKTPDFTASDWTTEPQPEPQP